MFKKLKSKIIILSALLLIAVLGGVWVTHMYINRDLFVSDFGYSFKKPEGYFVEDIFAEDSIRQETKIYLTDKDSLPFISISGPMINIGNEQLKKIREGRGYYKNGQDASSYVYLNDWKFPPVLIETSEGLFIVDFISYENSGVRNAIFNEKHLIIMRSIISTLDVKKGTLEKTQEIATKKGYSFDPLFDPMYERFGGGPYSYNQGASAPKDLGNIGDMYENEIRN